MQAPTYTPTQSPYQNAHYAPSPALPMGGVPTMQSYHSEQSYPTEVSAVPRPVEMDTFRGASELSDESVPHKIAPIEKVEETSRKE